MKKLVYKATTIILLLLLFSSCSAQKKKSSTLYLDYTNWNKYKVANNNLLEKVQILPIKLGESSMKIQIDTCFQTKRTTIIKGAVISKEVSNGWDVIGKKDVDIYVYEISDNGEYNNLLTSSKSSDNGKFLLEYNTYNKRFGILFSKKNEENILVSPYLFVPQKN